ncbi:nuclear pore complex protein Nup155 isoform X1 [Patella vulgata]|uniref:nuclear pore complex protein Nup155 isoform X1 n=2 Tax=Patella vulgata TaxID=6465 RepID=UPI0021806222|nr:nuclear pore complex protein Nup155 isoform X1 [Patella vulgata]
MASIIGSGLPPFAQQDVLDNAGRLIDKHIQEDQSYVDLSELIRVQTHNQPTVSGLHDYDYPSLLEVGMGIDSLREVSSAKRVPLPPELVEQFGRMQCSSMMGLFPEIERAWLAIDSDIFVWRYEDGTDLAYFDGLNENILSVALVKPKKDIFQPHIRYLLCIATPVDFVLLGVSFAKTYDGGGGEGGMGEMHLLPDPLFSIPTDNTYITSITGTDNGRIFMAGKDGCLYELVYQAQDGWFSRKCRKINHSTSNLSFLVPSFLNFSFSEDDPLVQISIDNSRNTLFARTEKGNIQVFDLGEDGKGMGRVASLSHQNITQSAYLIARTIDRSNYKTLVSISALTKAESSNIHLVAVTHSGVRLYFTTNPFGGSKSRPTMLTLVHVRLPPGFTANAVTQCPSKVNKCCYSKGVLMMVSSQNELNDLLWCVSNDSFPIQTQLMEAHTTLNIDGPTWAMAEVPWSSIINNDSGRTGRIEKADPPIVVQQHIEPCRRFIILSSQGSHIFQKLRPVEQLQQLLIDSQGPDSEEVKGFFRLHRVEQACATCLILACSSRRSAADPKVSDWARMAFFTYGGEPQYHYSASMAAHGMQPSNIGAVYSSVPATPSTTVVYSPSSPYNTSMSQNIQTPHPGMQPAHMSTPAQGYNQSYYQPSMMQPMGGPMQDVMFSGKHNGICIYLGRILRPFWDRPATTEFPCQTDQGLLYYFSSSFTSEEIIITLELVRDLSDFVDFNAQVDFGGSGESVASGFSSRMMGGRYSDAMMDDQTRKKLANEAQKLEKISLQHVRELIHQVEEVLGLWKVLVDHQFHVLAACLTKDQQNQLRSMTFKSLVINGRELCGSLITCLISRYLDDNATIDAISSRLRDVCPNLYSTDDATCSKANELLQATKTNQNQLEKRRQLQEALRLFKDVNQPLQLPAVCNQLASVNFYEGIVDLCLTESNKLDPQNLALHFYRCCEPPEDQQGMQAFINRMECYKCITDTLGYLWSASTSHPQAPSIPKSPGPPQAPDPTRISSVQAEQFRNEVFQLSLKSDDELFHVALYDWLFLDNHLDKLLEIQTPFMEPYLKRKSGTHGDNVAALDMLWKYYEKIHNFPAAARILSRLADRPGGDVSLQQRIEYLSRAIMCAKSATSRISSAAEGEFLHELEEKMEVARLQLQVHRALCKIPHRSPMMKEALNRLDSCLIDITKLYEDFADRFDLSECKLAIVHCAGLYDAALIENLWQNIIDKEFDACSSADNQSRVTNISNRLVAIAQLYSDTERYFPLAFILKYLEQKSCELNFDPHWVYRAMLQIHVSPEKLLELYDRMFKSKDPYWQTIHRPLHLLVVLHGFMTHFSNNPTSLPTMERRRFSTSCLDCVSSYLVELQAISSTNPNVRNLVQQFKALQAKLERLQY